MMITDIEVEGVSGKKVAQAETCVTSRDSSLSTVHPFILSFALTYVLLQTDAQEPFAYPDTFIFIAYLQKLFLLLLLVLLLVLYLEDPNTI